MNLLNKITNLVTFNFVCCNDFLRTGKNLQNNPNYILEKWEKYCNYQPNKQYSQTSNPDFKQFRDNYHQYWYCNNDIDRYLEYFWTIKKSTDLQFVISSFEYYFGSINNITSILQGGVHPTLKIEIDDWIESEDLNVIIRNLKLNNLIN